MKQCQHCRGLVPEALGDCPNCIVTTKRSGLKVAIATGLIAFTSCAKSSAVMVALYGGPPIEDTDDVPPRRAPAKASERDAGAP